MSDERTGRELTPRDAGSEIAPREAAPLSVERFDAGEAMVVTRVSTQRFPVDVEHGRDGPVADGMRCYLPARAMRAGDDPAQPIDVHLEESPIAGLALEVAAHGGGAADQ